MSYYKSDVKAITRKILIRSLSAWWKSYHHKNMSLVIRWKDFHMSMVHEKRSSLVQFLAQVWIFLKNLDLSAEDWVWAVSCSSYSQYSALVGKYSEALIIDTVYTWRIVMGNSWLHQELEPKPSITQNMYRLSMQMGRWILLQVYYTYGILTIHASLICLLSAAQDGQDKLYARITSKIHQTCRSKWLGTSKWPRNVTSFIDALHVESGPERTSRRLKVLSLYDN